MLKVYTVRLNGMGSSLILRMSVEKALQNLHIDANVTALDFGGLSSVKPDLVVTTPEVAKSMDGDLFKIVTITNFTDVNTIQTKIAEVIK